ncbi:hypothetical protein PspLS_02490 [Pyricularia sp. CBS 133598]|nr:hypothetical protein PspLS_02490 [Pyricularia sp. CBS 133598]
MPNENTELTVKWSTLKPQKEMKSDSSAMMTIPTFGVRDPSPATADRHWPPMTAITTQNPVRVAKFKMTGRVTR